MNINDIKNHLEKSFNLTITHIQPLGDGVNSYFNETFKCLAADGQKYALQCVQIASPVFAKDSYHNLSKVLAALKQAKHCQWYGYQQLELQPTLSGEFYVSYNDDLVLRVFKWIDSEEVTEVTEKIAYEAGKVLADFHLSVRHARGLSGLVNDTNAVEPLPHFHDSAWYLRQWQDALAKAEWADSSLDLTTHLAIIANGAALIADFDLFRQTQLLQQPRVMHGDPKLANMLFGHQQAVALIDYDTIMSGLWHYDVADALRSLCNTQSENGDIELVDFDMALFTAFMEGYAPALLAWTSTEKEMLVDAIALLPLELGIRFLFGCHHQHGLALDKQPLSAAKKSLIQLRLFERIKQKEVDIAQILQKIMPKTLITHPQIDEIVPVTVSISLRQTQTVLEVFYHLKSSSPLVERFTNIPLIKTEPNTAKGLWSNTCFELFIANKHSSAYVEFNGSPNGQSDVFAFLNERINMAHRPTSASTLPTCFSQAQYKWLCEVSQHEALAKVQFDLKSLVPIVDAATPLEVSITAVLKDSLTNKDYFLALCHTQDAPDFHARASFLGLHRLSDD